MSFPSLGSLRYTEMYFTRRYYHCPIECTSSTTVGCCGTWKEDRGVWKGVDIPLSLPCLCTTPIRNRSSGTPVKLQFSSPIVDTGP